jgi:hypothetical protein
LVLRIGDPPCLPSCTACSSRPYKSHVSGWPLAATTTTPKGMALQLRRQGATKKIKRENDVHLRQLAKKSTYVPSFFSFFLSAFLGVSRQGEFENTRKQIEYVSKKTPGKYFF